MKYENLEERYDRLFENQVMPFLKKKIPKNELSEPAYYLLEELEINRFRSALPLLIAREYNKEKEIVLPVAAFSEFTFSTAMAQDDFYDKDDCREGVKAAHKKFGTRRTLISCNYVNHRLIEIIKEELEGKISEDQETEMLRIANNGMKSWYLSALREKNSKSKLLEIDEEYVRKIYLEKTIHGRMMLEAVFSLVQDSERTLTEVNKYGKHLAIAGQLKNDIYDFVKHDQYRGFSDLRNGHITWPLLILLESLGDKKKEEFLERLRNNDYEYLLEVFRSKKISEKTIDKIDHHVEKAKEVIHRNDFPDGVEELMEVWAEGNRDFSRDPKI